MDMYAVFLGLDGVFYKVYVYHTPNPELTMQNMDVICRLAKCDYLGRSGNSVYLWIGVQHEKKR